MATVKALFKSLGIGAALYVIFHYLGDFSTQQSAVLIFVLWFGYGLYSNLNASRAEESSFSPFRVSIHPKWYPLLSDFKLVKSREEWDRLADATQRLPKSEYNIYRSGISFTVISPRLKYWDNYSSFVSKVDFAGSLVELEIEVGEIGGKHPFFNHPRWANLPEMYFKRGSDGYELGLQVQDDWWQQLCKTGEIGELASTKSNRDYRCGSTMLVVATLPYSEFGIYYQRDDYKRMKKRQETRDNQLEANGWKREVERDSEIRDPWSHVEHKYFTVSHRGI